MLRSADIWRGHCPHFWLRTGSYIGRIGSDCGCFRGSAGFSRTGARFESHLGHSKSPRQRGFCFQCVDIGPFRVPLTLVAARCLAPRSPMDYVGGGFRAMAGGRSAGIWGDWVSFLTLLMAVVGLHVFMSKSCGEDMTRWKFLEDSSSRFASFCRREGRAWGRISAQRGVDTVHTWLLSQKGCAQCAHPGPRATWIERLIRPQR